MGTKEEGNDSAGLDGQWQSGAGQYGHEDNDRACLAWANQMETTEAGRQAGKYDPGAEILAEQEQSKRSK